MTIPMSYTLSFLKHEDRLLLLNRNRPPYVGLWNGVGGKIEPGENLLDSACREIAEETGVLLEREQVRFSGTLTWDVDGALGGLYLFTAELDAELVHPAPRETEEGILAWKSLAWILDPENQGVASNLPYMLPVLFQTPVLYRHHCVYRQNQLVDYQRMRLEERAEQFVGIYGIEKS